MRAIFATLMVGLLAAAPAQSDEAAIQKVISDQIEAFQADDFAAAFAFASPTIRTIFGTADNFGAMVKQGYPMVWRPADVIFLPSETIEGVLWQPVMVRDQAGQLHILDYQMWRGESDWKINAVRLRPAIEGTA